MKVEQFVMAYGIEQDRIRAMLPEGFRSLRPVLRINTEIRESGGEENVYIELNTPVEGKGRRGWMNVASWQSPDTDINLERDGKAVIIRSKFIEIKYEGVGIEGGCPAEKDNDGCFFPGNGMELGLWNRSMKRKNSVTAVLPGISMKASHRERASGRLCRSSALSLKNSMRDRS
ncbi:MAG: hypothetical protein V8Q42_11055 [Anaerovoracaceae bacterium]